MLKKRFMIIFTVLAVGVQLFLIIPNVCYSGSWEGIMTLISFDYPETPEYGLNFSSRTNLLSKTESKQKLSENVAEFTRELNRRTDMIPYDSMNSFNSALYRATKRGVYSNESKFFYIVQIHALFTKDKFNDSELKKIIKRMDKLTPEEVKNWMKDKKDIEGINHAAILMVLDKKK